MGKLIKIFGVLFLLIIAAMIAIPYFFKDDIMLFAKQELNNNLNAIVDFKDIDLSLFKSFPNLHIGMQDLSVVGRQEFKGDTLAAIKDLNVAVNLKTLWNTTDKVRIKKIQLVQPNIHAKVLANGKANWDITIPSETPEKAATTAQASAYNLDLNKYEIKNGHITYEDAGTRTKVQLVGLNHTGKGNFTQDVYTLATNTNIAAFSADYDGLQYLKKVKTKAKADIEINNTNGKYTFKDNLFQLNALALGLDGFVQMPSNSNSIKMDLKLNAAETAFKEILSLLPSAYTADYEDVKASGKASVDGFVKGTLSDKTLPGFNFNINVADGEFQYPDLPKSVSDIQVNMNLENKDGITDNTLIDVSKFDFKVGTNPFAITAKVQHPTSDPNFDVTAKGKMNLLDLVQSYPLEGVTALKGLLDADVVAKGKMSDVEAGRYQDLNIEGKVQLNDLYYAGESVPKPVSIPSANMQFTTQEFNLNQLNGSMGETNFDGKGKIKNMLGKNPSFDVQGKGTFNLAEINEMYPVEGVTKLAGKVNGNLAIKGDMKAYEEERYEDFDVKGKVDIKNMLYEATDLPYPVNLNAVVMDFTPQNVKLKQLDGKTGSTDFKANGVIDNVLGYVLSDGTIKGNISVQSNKVNCNEWMTSTEEETGTETASTSAEAEPYEIIKVPGNIDMTIAANAKEVLYDDLNLTKVSGKLIVKDEKVRLQDMQTNVFDGELGINGTYSTKNTAKPVVDLDYDIKNIDVQQAFLHFNSFKQLVPVAKFVEGTFSSSLKLDGQLGEDMMPEMMTFSGDGMAAMLKATLVNCEPLVMVGKALKLDRLKRIEVLDLETFFAVDKGRVKVKPFTVSPEGINMLIGGSHGFDQSLDYNILATIPAKLLGSQAGALMGNLTSLAKQKGINFEAPENLDVKINLTGTFDKPKVAIDYESTLAAAQNSIKDLAKDLMNEAQAKAEELKDMAVEKAEAMKDELETQAQEKAAELKNMANEEVTKAKEELKNEVNKGMEATQDYVKDKAGEAKDMAVEEAAKAKDDLLKDGKDQIKGASDSLKNNIKGQAAGKAKDAIKGLFGKKKKKK